MNPAFDPAGEGGGRVRFRAEKVCPKGRAEGQGDKGGDGDRTGQGDGELPKENARGSTLESDGKKDHDEAGGDGEHGPGDFLHRKNTGLEGRHALLDVTHDVLEHHDGVIYHDANGQHEGEECENIDTVVEEVEQSEGGEDGKGNSRGRNQGGANIMEKKVDEEDDENKGEA